VRRKEQAIDERQRRRTGTERPEPTETRPNAQKGRLVRRGEGSRSKGDRRKEKFDIHWLNLQPLYDFWGNRIPRFYSMQSLVRATEGVLHGNDRFLLPSAQQVIGPSPLTSMTFELFQEGKFQLIFLLRAVNDKRKVATFAFVAAKRPGEFSKVAAEEFDNLVILHGRDPEHVVRPYRGSKLVIFDRNLGDESKQIFAYLTQWLADYHEMGVSKNLQFYVNIKTPVTFTAAQTEDIKGQIIEVIARSYDAEAGLAMEMPQIASGDFVVTLPSSGRPRIKLIACRRLLRNMTPTRVLHRILDAHWDWGGRDFRLAPEKAETILEGLERALGKETAMTWLTDYRKRLEAGTFREVPPLTLEALKELGA
jgi:hypothetical protein